jgi:hypothetical protein
LGERDKLYYPFEEAFREQVSSTIATLLETEGFVKLRDIGIASGTTEIIDELCMDDFICDAVFYVLVWIRNFFLDQKNSGLKQRWNMDGRNIKIRSFPTQYIMISRL